MVVQWVDNATHLHVSAARTLKRSYSVPVQAIEVTEVLHLMIVHRVPGTNLAEFIQSCLASEMSPTCVNDLCMS